MIKCYPKKIKILTAMAQKGFNQKSLADAAQLNTSTISLFLNGKRNISPTSARKIAEALDSELEELFEFQFQFQESEVNYKCQLQR